MQSVIKEHVASWFILSLSTDSGLYFSLFTLLVPRRLCHHPRFRDEGLRLQRVSSTVSTAVDLVPVNWNRTEMQGPTLEPILPQSSCSLMASPGTGPFKGSHFPSLGPITHHKVPMPLSGHEDSDRP